MKHFGTPLKCFAGALFVAICCSGAAASEVRVKERLDLQRYLGKWHEIATIPQFFQRKCVRDTVAEYSLLESGELRVENTCTREDGGRDKIEGRARRPDAAAEAKLEVSFVKLFGEYRFWAGGDYWVIELDPNYQWVVVGHPSRRYGWVLSRKQVLPVEVIAEIIGRVKAQGYDACQFFVTPQTGGMTIRRPFCEALP